MAFLQLKKEPHKDKPINIKLLGDWSDAVAKQNPFGKTEYELLAVNVGNDIPTSKDVDPYKIKKGNEFDFKMSESLFKKVKEYDKGTVLKVGMMSKDKDNPNDDSVIWQVKQVEANGEVENVADVKDDGSGTQPAQDTPPKSYTSRSTNDSIESQVQLKEIAPVLRVASEAGLDITKPLPEGFISNVQTVYHNLKSVMSVVPTQPHNTGLTKALEESSTKASDDDDLPF